MTAARRALGALALAAGATLTSPTHAQPGPSFEAASVKIVQDAQVALSPMGTNRFSARGLPLTVLMAFAYGTDDDRVLGGPSWRTSEQYEINAKAEDGIVITWDSVQPMLQHLLAERFKLVVHREEKKEQGYALVVDRGTPKLKSAADGASTFGAILPRQLRAGAATMASFAGLIGRALGQPIVDETHVDGSYVIALTFAPLNTPASDRPSIFTALQEQMGLRLERRTVPVSVVVIDHVEHPSED